MEERTAALHSSLKAHSETPSLRCRVIPCKGKEKHLYENVCLFSKITLKSYFTEHHLKKNSNKMFPLKALDMSKVYVKFCNTKFTAK